MFLYAKCFQVNFSYNGFLDGSDSKESACNAGDIRDTGLIPGSGRSPGGGHGNPLQNSCLENPMDRGAWWSIGWQSVAHDWSELACTQMHHDTAMRLVMELWKSHTFTPWECPGILYLPHSRCPVRRKATKVKEKRETRRHQKGMAGHPGWLATADDSKEIQMGCQVFKPRRQGAC